MKKTELNSLLLRQLEDFMLSIGEKKFRAKQLFKHMHGGKNFNMDNISVFSEKTKNKILNSGYINWPEIIKVFASKIDKTTKFLIKLDDGNIVETVYMGYKDRNTLCISSQVGCKMGCSFCASTKSSFIRSLKVSEIVSQVYLVENYLDINIDNVVYMGIGEPLDNLRNTISSILILNDKDGKNLSQRSITVSTSGLADKIYDLANENLSINLAISLHYPFDDQRSLFMPINKRFNIEKVLDACDYYFKETGRRVSFEYVLIKDLNDTDRHINELKKLFKNKNIHINLIPLNEIEEFDYLSTSKNMALEFQKKLFNAGLNATIRQKRGIDIDGACGQLRVSYEGGEI